MDIGRRIKEIRTGKLMTQSQLAGDEITRNMLSRIENGAALPSLGTVMYLAQRLGVPAGVLLSDDDSEYNFKRSSLIGKIKNSYSAREYELCLDMCVESASEADDEICYIAANCCVRLAEEELILGHLYRARDLIGDAISYSHKTVYDTSAIISRATVMLSFLVGISPMLDFEMLDDTVTLGRARKISAASPLCRYIDVLWSMGDKNYAAAKEYISEECDCSDKLSGFYCKHVEAKVKMEEGDFFAARDILLSVLSLEDMTFKLLAYLLNQDLEICCRETEDYRGAYEASSTKLGLVESMLRES